MDKAIFDIYLLSGNLTIFCGAHADDFKSDILHCSLYAELVAAQGENDRQMLWSTYTKTVSRFGWTIKSKEIQRVEFANTSLLNVIKQNNESALPEDALQVLSQAFSSLQKLDSNCSAIKAFTNKLQSNASVGGDTHALLTIVRNDRTVVTLQIAFRTRSPMSIDVLDLPVVEAIDDVGNNIRLMCSVLDSLQYARFRDEVIKKLGHKCETDLIHLRTATC